MKNYSALIIDDEPKACRLLNSLIDEFCHEISEVDVFTKPQEALLSIEQNHPDLLFIDINMPDLNGFELLDRLDNYKGKVIFTTAYEDFALKAFKYSAFDYLLKPLKIDELIDTVKRVVESDQIKPISDYKEIIETAIEKEHYKSSIAIHDKGGMIFIQVKDILYLEGQGNYTNIHCIDKKYLSSKTSKSFEAILDPSVFVRVHRSYIVNITKVVKYSPKEGGELEMVDRFCIPVSRRKRHVLKEFSIK